MKFRSLVLILFLISIISKAQDTTPYDFLNLDVSPRAAAVAGGFVSNNDDPNVLFYNPAGLYNLEGKPASFSFFNHITDIKTVSLAYSQEINNWGRFAAGIQYVSYGDFDKRDENGNILGSFSAGDFALTLGYTNKLEENFNYGVSAKVIYTSIDDVSSTAIALDAGLMYLIPDQRITIGLSFMNLGQQISSYYGTKEDVPLDIRLGVSKRLAHLPLKFYVSLNKLNDNEDRFKKFTLGAELSMSKALTLRLGYDNEKRDEFKLGSSSAGLAGFSLGLGLKVKSYHFDYAYSSLGEIGSWHRIGITTKL